MIMAKEIEDIEGGDESGDALEYTGDDTEKEEPTHEEDDSDQKPRPSEDHRVEGGDDEWDKEQDGADLEYTGDEKGGKEGVKEAKKEEEVEVEKVETEEKEKVEKKEETVEIKELSEEEKRDEKIKEDIIKHLEGDGGTKYVVKGKEYDLADLSPQEIRDRFSKAGRFYERMEEISAREKQIIERERLAEDGARKSYEIMQKYGGEEPKDTATSLPEFFKPDSDDDFETKSLKKGYADLYAEVDKLKRGREEQDFAVQKQDLFRQLDSLEAEFPMLSKSEVIAIKSMPEYSGVDMRTIAENSHNARVSDEYLDAVFKARPDRLRELKEKAIEEHLMKNPKVSKVSRKKSSTTASKKLSSKKKEGGWTFDKIEAREDDMIRGYKESLEDMED